MAKKYATVEILRSEEFAAYQPDFLRAILTKDEYTLAEARKAAKEFFEEKEGK